jgi:hypothetical protein
MLKSRDLRLQVDAASETTIQCLLQLPHLFLDALKLGLECFDLAVDGLCRRLQQLKNLRLW